MAALAWFDVGVTAPAATPDFRALLGPAAWLRLDPEVRRRFASGHGPVCYPGEMTLWCSPIGAVFAVLARALGGPLPAVLAVDAPAEVMVFADGRGGVVWQRRLELASGPVQIRSTKRCDSDGVLLECVDGGLGMVLALMEEDGALVFESRSYFLAFGRWRLPLPALLTPGRCRVVHRPVATDRFRFELDMTHPFWGTTFRQSGLFHDPEI
jgi:hypothetical protein